MARGNTPYGVNYKHHCSEAPFVVKPVRAVVRWLTGSTFSADLDVSLPALDVSVLQRNKQFSISR